MYASVSISNTYNMTSCQSILYKTSVSGEKHTDLVLNKTASYSAKAILRSDLDSDTTSTNWVGIFQIYVSLLWNLLFGCICLLSCCRGIHSRDQRSGEKPAPATSMKILTSFGSHQLLQLNYNLYLLQNKDCGFYHSVVVVQRSCFMATMKSRLQQPAIINIRKQQSF